MKVKKLIVFGMTMMAILVSCERHPSFSSSEEALQGCKQQLELLKQKQDASIEDLSSLTSTWLEVRDSAYSSFGRDSSLNLKSPMAVAYFMVSDSIRAEITRLAFVKPRSLREVMYFKLNTAMQRKVLEKNAIYKDAVKYYEKLDTYPLYPSLKTTLAAYGKLLSSATSFKQGDELMNFIALEDKCFRSLMKYLAQVDTETLQKLTMGTTRVFDGLYSSVGAQVDDVNDRTMLYLSMRFNRRIIQNALACKEDILSRRRLGNTQQANYRWMLIQPFMAIDDYSAAVLTEEQREQLLALSDDLPGLLERLDARKHVRDKECDVDFSVYFENVVGVTKPDGAEPILVKLRIERGEYPYIESKPIHASQKVISEYGDDKDYVYVSLYVYDNFELRSKILSYGSKVTVMEP